MLLTHANVRPDQKLRQQEPKLLRRLSRSFRVLGRRHCKGKKLKRRNLWRRQRPN
jgi:hypothetical protein